MYPDFIEVFSVVSGITYEDGHCFTPCVFMCYVNEVLKMVALHLTNYRT
jgi:hypothetical protein